MQESDKVEVQGTKIRTLVNPTAWPINPNESLTGMFASHVRTHTVSHQYYRECVHKLYLGSVNSKDHLTSHLILGCNQSGPSITSYLH